MIIAQISDPHVTVEDARADGRPSTAELMRRAVAHLLALPSPPDVVLVTGDCTDHGSAGEFARFRDLLRPLTMPVFTIPGNHDDRERVREEFGPQGSKPMDEFVQYVVENRPVRLVALDTVVPGRDEGLLCEARLRWLDERLSEAPDRPTLVFMHHPPFATGLDVLDRLGLAGVEEFGAIVERHPQVERIVAGHIHCGLQRRFHGTVAMTCTSTALQIRIDHARADRLSSVMEPASCLLHAWAPATGLLSYVSPIGDHGPVTEIHDGEKWLG